MTIGTDLPAQCLSPWTHHPHDHHPAEDGARIRGGHHCAMPLMTALACPHSSGSVGLLTTELSTLAVGIRKPNDLHVPPDRRSTKTDPITIKSGTRLSDDAVPPRVIDCGDSVDFLITMTKDASLARPPEAAVPSVRPRLMLSNGTPLA